MRKNLGGPALGKYRALVHYDDTVAAIRQVIHAVRNHDDGQAPMVKSIDELQEITARRRSSPAIGSSSTGELRLHGKHASKRHAPLLPAGELKGVLVAHRGQVETHARER